MKIIKTEEAKSVLTMSEDTHLTDAQTNLDNVIAYHETKGYKLEYRGEKRALMTFKGTSEFDGIGTAVNTGKIIISIEE